MDYEKKYKEALKKAKSIYRDAKEAGCSHTDWLEHIFPQLAESENEKIIKTLQEYVKNRNWILNGPSYGEVLAWLEKQKEQKPVECIEFENEFTKQVSHLLASVINKENEYNKGFVEYVAQSLLGYAKHEIKPADWSEFDKGALKDAICAADILGNDESFNKCNPNLAKAFRVAKDWLESLPERFNFQPKPECSKEDEVHRDFILELLEGQIKFCKKDAKGAYYTKQIRTAQNWLKSLCSQPQKEIYLGAKHDLAIKFMNYLDENRPEGKMCLSNGECEDIDKAFKENDWVKIMRYIEKYSSHWKPSEEQMKALKNSAYGAHQNSDGPALRELYEQLNKL